MELSLIFTLCLAIIICNCSWRTAAQSLPNSSTCQVEYIEQPPNQLQCNPYTNAQLRLECTVTAQPNQNPTLLWYRRQLVQSQQSREQQRQEEEESHSRSKRSEQWIVEKLDPSSQDVYIYHQERTSPMSNSARSRLVLRNLAGSDAGEYYCVAQVDGVELSVPSDAVLLREPTFYSSLGACATTGALSKQESKCADGSTVVATTAVPGIPTVMPTAKDIATSSPPSAKPPTMTVSKPSSSETGRDGRGGGGATTSAVPNPIDEETTIDPTQAGNTDNSQSSVPAEEELIEENPSAANDKKDPNVLLELYIAIAILVMFGVVIMILIPITVWMCLRKRQTRKVEGIRRQSRRNLEFVSPHCSSGGSSELPSPSVVSQVASDYLVPQPSWRSHKQQNVQPSDYQKPTALQRSYEITLSYSHEYEDVQDVIEEGATQLGLYVNERPTVEVLETGSPPAHVGVYVNDGPVRMKRNAAYRTYSMVNSDENSRRNGYCNEVTVSNPLNCLYAAQHSTNEQLSNLE